MEFAAFKFRIVTPPRAAGVLLFLVFLKYTKKLKFVALLKDFFNFVPRGTNVNNFFVRKILKNV